MEEEPRTEVTPGEVCVVEHSEQVGMKLLEIGQCVVEETDLLEVDFTWEAYRQRCIHQDQDIQHGLNWRA
jgi:hypothetical protein